MVLSYKKIKKLISKNILIKNGNNQNIMASSYDVTVDKCILKFKKAKDPISLINASELSTMYEEVDITKGYTLNPKLTILVVLEEEFNIPANICGIICGRTSFNRLGLTIPIQYLNPGFKGKLNLTITNNSTNSFVLTPKIQIAQVVFMKLDRKVPKDKVYSSKSRHSYQNKNGHQGSMVYNDYIGKVVRHFKGNYYYIEDIGMDSETKEFTVIYRNLYEREDSNIWARPAKMFFEEVDPNREGNITHQTHRFEVVNELAVDYTKNKKDKK